MLFTLHFLTTFILWLKMISILLNKLNHYGFRGIINDWFSSYLNNRTQTTQVGHHISDKAIITCGVPQGSIIGPLLFLLYVNDILKCPNKLLLMTLISSTLMKM